MMHEQIHKNKRKTIWLMALFCLVLFGIGWAIGYLLNGDMYSGIITTAIVLVFYLPISYWTSSMQVLKMSGAKRLKYEDHPVLFDIVEELTIPARIPMPKIYVVYDKAPNAFATGVKPKKASVAVTTGLLNIVNREELEGVIAHELGHIRNYDIRLMTVSVSLVSLIVLIAEFGRRFMFFFGYARRRSNNQLNMVLMLVALAFIIFGPIAASAIRMAVSRNREYLADASAVEFTRNPEGLIRALAKISGANIDSRHAKKETEGMYIANPFRKKRRKKKSYFWSTHPPMEKRIERLKNM